MTDIKNQFNNSNFTNTVFQYGEKQIKKYLGQRPFHTDVFLGRDNDLENVHQIFSGEHNLLLLVNGEGGIGKTTLASRYYLKHADHYQHVGCIFAEKSLEDALLSLAPDLDLKFENETREERLQLLFDALHQLNKPSLLIIDNANEYDQLETLYRLLHTLDNFHLLISTRITECNQAKTYKIEPLSDKDAKALFVQYYPKHKTTDDQLLTELLAAIGKNTLVIELLAKHLNNKNLFKINYSLQNLVDELKTKGLFAIEGKNIDTDYQAKGTGLRREKPEVILSAMYDLTALTVDERILLSVFAVLPAENIPFAQLETLLPESTSLEDTLLSLSQKGWLDTSKEEETSFKTSPVIQETVKVKNKALDDDCAELVYSLLDKLDYDPSTGHLNNLSSYSDAIIYVRYAHSITFCKNIMSYNSIVLQERLGNYFQTTGDLIKALEMYEWFSERIKKHHGAEADDKNYKNILAISYGKLGQTHLELGNLNKALAYFDNITVLFEELYKANPQNMEFKKNLAISYSKLGEIHLVEGNLHKALAYFDEVTILSKELYEVYSQNVEFKKNLAISYKNLGEIYSKLIYLDNALTYFEDFSRLMEELNKAYPQDVGFKNGLAISYEKLGQSHSELDNLDIAIVYFNDETVLFEELFEAYPQNVGFKNGLAISYEKLGVTHSLLGNLDKALAYFKDKTILCEELYEAYPQNVKFKNGLATSYANLGEFHQEKRNDIQTAKTYFQQAEQLWAELVAVSPQYADFKKNLENVKIVLATLT
jgi:tetratricopeptide (TPR) repeat protein